MLNVGADAFTDALPTSPNGVAAVTGVTMGPTVAPTVALLTLRVTGVAVVPASIFLDYAQLQGSAGTLTHCLIQILTQFAPFNMFVFLSIEMFSTHMLLLFFAGGICRTQAIVVSALVVPVRFSS